MAGVLSGFSIGVTSDHRSDEQIQMLEGRGACCVHGPMLRTHRMRPEADIFEATQALIAMAPDITVVLTGIGARGWLAAADSLRIGDELRSALAASQIIVRGPKVAGAIVAAGLEVSWSAPGATTEDVFAELEQRGVAGKTIAVLCNGDPAGSVVERIRGLGAEVVEVSVYQWSLPDDIGPAEALIRAALDGRIDALTFTSRPAVMNFASIAEEIGVWAEVSQLEIPIFAIGELTAASVADCGLGTAHTPDRPSLGELVMHVTTTMSSESFVADLAGHPVSLRGRMVTIDGSAPTMLSARERRVFEVLLQRPGVVHSKAALLELVWGDEYPDPHVVEVTIGRLRARLGKAGDGIETVVRRGYRVTPA